jgi:hypothetical protein
MVVGELEQKERRCIPCTGQSRSSARGLLIAVEWLMLRSTETPARGRNSVASDRLAKIEC